MTRAALEAFLNRLVSIFKDASQPLPKPRAIALRALEEAVELCLACGASPADVHSSIHNALHHEFFKHPDRGFHNGVIDPEEIVGELADVGLLNGFVQRLAMISDNEVSQLAGFKIERLELAQQQDKLRWTDDGRFYRIKPAVGDSLALLGLKP